MSVPRRLQVFLCHAAQDKPKVRELLRRLESESWIAPWLDEEKLLPGQDWDLEIQKAIRAADIIIVCLSRESVSKEGYVQKEFRRALSYAEEKPEGTIYIIPLRLDDCEIPIRFQQWQWLDYSVKNAWEKLLLSLRLRAEKLGIAHDSGIKNPSASIAVSGKLHPEPSGFTPGGRPFYMFGGMEFVEVISGDFYMGADDIDDASPQHLVYQLDYDFYIGRYPVTNQEFSLYLRETRQPVVMAKGKAKHPVVNSSWNQIQDYLTWLNEKYRSILPAKYKFVLPSEAEWEKSARGVEGNEFPWGNDFDLKRCNSREGGKADTTPVGTYSPQGDSAFGAADMAGNVREWTRSLGAKLMILGSSIELFAYPYRIDDGREDTYSDIDAEIVLRGGSFKNSQMEVRCAKRTWAKSGSTTNATGFRLAICPVNK